MGRSLGELIHWYDTSRCNLECPGCFRERGLVEVSLEKRKDLAKSLIYHGAKQVNFGNGEPLLVPELKEVLEILHDSGVFTAIHTNGILLDKDKIAELAPVTDEIALPIDSLNPETQQRIRGKRFMPVIGRFQDLVGMIHEADIQVGYHTVFTSINHQEIGQIYKFLSKDYFNYWRIYEFNKNLPMKTLEQMFFKLSRKDREGILGRKIQARAREVQRFAASPRDPYSEDLDPKYNGDVDCLFAKFILKEEEMKRYHDKRVQFVGVSDPNKRPYLFLDGQGNLTTYFWFSTDRRIYVGNLLKDRFRKIKKRLIELEDEEPDVGSLELSDFCATEWQRPLWARYWEGAFMNEEFEGGFDKRYSDRFMKLTELYIKRRRRLLKAGYKEDD